MPLDLAKDIVIRWEDTAPAHVPLLAECGATAVLPSSPSEAFSAACAQKGIAAVAASDLQFSTLAELPSSSGNNVVLTAGIWPGIAKPPAVAGRGDETASASREPWVDANGYWVGYLRALYPQRPPVLGYVPRLGDRHVPFDSLELALVEAWTAGGNYILSVEPEYRDALLRNDAAAIAAWKQLGRTARWLRENIALFRQPALATIAALVEPGAPTAEIVNLLYRRNASPAVFAAASVPPPDPSRLALVAANLRRPAPDVAKRILAHAEAGTTVVVAAPPNARWWQSAPLKLVRNEPDRVFLAFGKGRVVAYHAAIQDPSEFALDVIDIVTHRNRPVRLWNAPAVIALATASPRPGERLVHLVNYGRPIDVDVQTRVQGLFTKALLLRPDAPPQTLQPAKRGNTTEVMVPELKRLGVVVFA